MVELPNLMPPRGTCLPLDTKYPRECTKLYRSVEYTPRETRKSTFFCQDHKRKNKAYHIINYFLHHFITPLEYLNKLNATAGLKQFTCNRLYTF